MKINYDLVPDLLQSDKFKEMVWYFGLRDFKEGGIKGLALLAVAACAPKEKWEEFIQRPELWPPQEEVEEFLKVKSNFEYIFTIAERLLGGRRVPHKN